MVGDISSINHHESLFPQMALKVFKLKPHRPIYWHHSLTVLLSQNKTTIPSNVPIRYAVFF